MIQRYIDWERMGCQHSDTGILRVGEEGANTVMQEYIEWGRKEQAKRY